MSYTDEQLKEAISNGYDTVPAMTKHFMGIQSAYIRNVDFATYKKYRLTATSIRRRLYSLEKNKVIEKAGTVYRDGCPVVQYRWAI